MHYLQTFVYFYKWYAPDIKYCMMNDQAWFNFPLGKH